MTRFRGLGVSLDDAVDGVLRSGITRRRFLRAGTALAGSMLVVPLLAACGGDDDDNEAATATKPAASPTTSGGTAASPTTATSASPTTGSSSASPTGAGSAPTATTAAAATPTTAAAQPTATEGSTGEAGSGGSLITVHANDSDSLDPQRTVLGDSAVVFDNLYDTLVSKTPDLTFEGLIAEKFTISDDGLNYDFTIRKGLTFHDGSDLTADMVKYTFDRGTDPANPSQAASFISAYDHAELLDADNVRLVLKEPNAPFVANIAVSYFGILPQAAVEAKGDDFGKSPVGSGPWMFDEWIEGEQITLKPYADYINYRTWVDNKGAPRADELVFRVIPETQTQVAAFETGEINSMLTVPASEYPNFKDNEDYQVIVAEGGTSITSVEFQTIKPPEGQAPGDAQFKPPFDDLKIRQSVAYAIDADSIINEVLNGLAQRDFGPMPTGLYQYDPAIEEFGYAYDPDKANSLLDEAGWTMGGDNVREKDGNKLEVKFWVWSGGNEEKIAQVWQNQLGEVGMKLNIETLDIGTMVARLPEGANDINYMQVGWPEADILFVLTSFDWGVGRYQPKDYIDLITQARQTSDQDERKKLYFDAQKLFLEDLPWVPMWTELAVTAVRKEVKGFHVGADLNPIWVDSWVE